MAFWIALLTGAMKLIGLVDKAEDIYANWQQKNLQQKADQAAYLEASLKAKTQECWAIKNAPQTKEQTEKRLDDGTA